MKKKMIYVVTAFVLGTITVFNVKTLLDVNLNCDLIMTSIDALSKNASGDREGASCRYEYPDGYIYPSACNVLICEYKKYEIKIITYQSRSIGYNSKKDPTHKL